MAFFHDVATRAPQAHAAFEARIAALQPPSAYRVIACFTGHASYRCAVAVFPSFLAALEATETLPRGFKDRILIEAVYGHRHPAVQPARTRILGIGSINGRRHADPFAD